MKLANRIVLLVVVLALLFGITSSSLINWSLREHLTANQEEWTHTLAHAIAEGISLDTINGDIVHARETLATIVNDDVALEYAYIVDFDGRLFTHSFEKGLPRFLVQQAYGAKHRHKGHGYRQIFFTTRGEILDVAHPLIDGMNAYLHIGVSQNKITTLIGSARKDTILVLLLMTLLGTLIALLMGRRISNPLRRLSKWMYAFGEGQQMGDMDIGKTDPEVGALAATFKGMVKSRSEAVEELRQREQFLSLTLDSIGDAVIVTDDKGCITRMNRIAESLTGWQEEESKGKYLTEVFRIINAHSREMATDPVEKVLALGVIVGLANHTVLIAKDGSEHQIADSGAPIRGITGETLGVILVFRDITKDYQAQENLRHSEANLAQAQRIAKLGNWSLDLKDNSLKWSDEVFRIFEVDPDKFGASYEAFLEWVHPDDRGLVDKAYTESVQNRTPYNIDHRLLMKDGSIRYVHETCETDYDKSGKPLSSTGTVQDITERLQAEFARSKIEQRLGLVIEQTPLGFIEWDTEFKVTDWNPAAEQIFGYSRKEALGRHAADLIVPESAREAVDAIWQDLISKQGGQHSINGNNTKDGKARLCEWYNAALVGKDGQVVGVASLVDDITERKHNEEALRRTQKMEAIGQLSGGIAHDFNNQLGIIMGCLDYMGRYVEESERSRKWIETASRATQRCASLTEQLLTFSRAQPKETSVIDLNSLIKDLVNVLARSVTPEVDIQYCLAKNLWRCKLDPGDFQDVLLNLVINARDAMPQGGRLVIETSNIHLDKEYTSINPGVSLGDYVQFTLSDTGTGMSKEILERVYEPFFTTKPEGRGSGLGLSMVYAFTRRSGGHIKIYSEVGHGTTFHIYLPRTESIAAQTIVEDTSTSALRTGTETILIVDDEEDLLQLADDYLTESGYRTLSALNAGQALDILSGDEHIDMLFSDVVMPGGMDGYMLAQKAVEMRPDLKVLLTSGFTSKIISENGLARFSSNILSKPYRKISLVRKIRDVLDAKGET